MSVTIGTGQTSSFSNAPPDGDDTDAAAFAALAAEQPTRDGTDRGGDTAGQVNAFYQDLLGQDADPAAMGTIQDAMAGGQSLGEVETSLRPVLARSDAATATINGFYQQSFNRAATPDEVGNIEGALANGQSLLGIETRLNPASTSGNPTLGTINDLYQRLFGRNALPEEVDGFMDAATCGVNVQDYAAFLQPAFAKSNAEVGTVNAFYRQSFGRDATPGELAKIEGALGAGKSLLGVETALDPAGTSRNPTLGAINDFYQRLFGRNALQPEVDSFLGAMAHGQSLQDYAAALRPTFAKSDAEAGTINAFYRQSFGRDATTGELGNIEGALGAGRSLLGIETALDPDGTPANPTLVAVDDFYQRLFGRNALQPEVDSFLDAMAHGQSVQASVAALRPELAKSQAEVGTINAFYQAVAGRPARPDELANIEGALTGGEALDDIEIAQTPGLLAEAQAQRQARADATDATYRQVLNRGATAAELADREREFAAGQTVAGVRDGLAHSGEAAADIDRLYQDLLGHGVDAASLTVIQAQLAAGASLGDYRAIFAQTSAAVASTVADLFQGALRRAPGGAELDYWRGRLAEGGSLGDLRAALAQNRRVDYLAYHPGLSPGIFPAPIPYDPAIDAEEGYAPPNAPVTLLGADGAVLASNAARDVLAVLPVYVTLNGGASPSLRLANGGTLSFGNAVELANYLNRTAQRASPNDPLLGTAYGQTSAWLGQVD